MASQKKCYKWETVPMQGQISCCGAVTSWIPGRYELPYTISFFISDPLGVFRAWKTYLERPWDWNLRVMRPLNFNIWGPFLQAAPRAPDPWALIGPCFKQY